MKRHPLLTTALTVLSFLSLSGFLAGCSEMSPLDPSDAHQVVGTESPDFVSLSPISRGSLPQGDGLTACAKVVSADLGGTLSNGYVTLDFPPGALSHDTEISITMTQPGVMAFELQPHGIQFNKPVLLSFDNFDASGDILKVVWFDEGKSKWVVIGTGADAESLGTSLAHFSSYGISG
jgi:hypothetical protein